MIIEHPITPNISDHQQLPQGGPRGGPGRGDDRRAGQAAGAHALAHDTDPAETPQYLHIGGINQIKSISSRAENKIYQILG